MRKHEKYVDVIQSSVNVCIWEGHYTDHGAMGTAVKSTHGPDDESFF